MSSITPTVDGMVKETIAKLVANGVPLVEAANMVGMSKRAVDAMLRSDSDFRDDVSEAHARMIAKIDRVVFEEALDGRMDAVKLFYQKHQPEVMAPQAQKNAAQPAVQVAQMTVQVVQALVTGSNAPQWLEMLHGRPEAVEATVVDDTDS